MNLEKEIFEIPLTDIMPNRFQPREIFDDEALQELAQSIKTHGVIQPIIVRKIGDKFEIIAGERRYRASQLAGKTTIPALIRDIDNKEAAKVALLENLQRRDLSPIEEARTYQTILKLDNITQEELAENLGKSQSAIANKLRLLNLDESVQVALLNGQISERHARSLLNVADKNKQKELVEKIIQNRMTVRQLDEEIKNMENKSSTSFDAPTKPINGPISDEKMLDNLINGTEPTPSFNFAQAQEPTEVKTPEITIEEPHPSVVIPNVEPISLQNQVQAPVVENPLPPTPEVAQIPKFNPNIFESLRMDNDQFVQTSFEQETPLETKEPGPSEDAKDSKDLVYPNIPNLNATETVKENSIYDLRFAINNVRQAIQNTKKFGFDVEAEEYDLDKDYQFVITIKKNDKV